MIRWSLLAVMFLVAPGSASVAAPASVLFSGRAFGAFVNVDPVLATMICDTGDLPSDGGTLETTASDVLLANVLSAEFMSMQVQSTAAGVNCHAQTVGLSMLAGTPAALTASLVSSAAHAICGGNASSASADDLVFGGTPIQLTGPNQTVTIPGVATLIIHERIASLTPTSSEITAFARAAPDKIRN